MTELVKTLLVTHKSGLHARASTLFVELARKYDADVYVSRGDGGGEVDGKSIVGIMTLGIEMGHDIVLRVVGADATKAMDALEGLVKANFHGV